MLRILNKEHRFKIVKIVPALYLDPVKSERQINICMTYLLNVEYFLTTIDKKMSQLK